MPRQLVLDIEVKLLHIRPDDVQLLTPPPHFNDRARDRARRCRDSRGPSDLRITASLPGSGQSRSAARVQRSPPDME